MNFNDTGASKNGLIQHCESLLDLPDATISGDATLLATITRYINVWYHRFAMRLWKTSGTWEFDDTTNTDYPIATTTIVNNQRDYPMPTNAVKVYRVRVKDTNGYWRDLEYTDENRISDIDNETAGFPTMYYIVDDALFLYPKPNTAVLTAAKGLQLWLAREVTEFTTADTTKEPGFPKMYHSVPALGAAYTHASIKGMSMKGFLHDELREFIPEIDEFEEEKNRDERVIIQARVSDYR